MPRKPKQEKHKGVYEKIKGSGIWWIRYTNAKSRRVTTSVGTHGAAVALYDRRKMELRAGVVAPPTVKRGAKFYELVSDAIQFYIDSEKSDVLNLKQRTNQALPEFGNRIAETISGKELQAWMDKTSAERQWSGGTRNAMRAALGTVFREGMRSEKVSNNPARLTRRAKESGGRIRFLTWDEEAKLRRHGEIQPNCIAQLDIALHTGMRRKEQFTVTMDQVDFEQKCIFLTKTKNGSSRYVHLNSAALRTLNLLRTAHQRLNLPADAPLFLSQRDGEIKNPRKWFSTAMKKAGIAGVTWHILRHTFASRLVMADINLRTVQELMGHKTLAMTARYAHLAPDHQLKALEVLVSKGTNWEPNVPESGSQDGYPIGGTDLGLVVAGTNWEQSGSPNGYQR